MASKTDFKILIVEDEMMISQFIWDTLLFLGFQPVGMITNGPQALDFLRETAVDLVLMDIRIEGPMDGVETAQQVSDELQVPVIFLTAFDDEQTLDKALNTMPYGYIVKPFSQNDLRIVLQLAQKRILALKKDNPVFIETDKNESTEKKSFSNLTALDLEKILDKIDFLLQEEKIFKDSEISLPGFAQHLGITSHQLSEILNKKIGKSFYNLMKEYRIKEAQQIIQTDPDRRMIYVALESGFNSKSSFNAAFKQEVGVPPLVYRNSLY